MPRRVSRRAQYHHFAVAEHVVVALDCLVFCTLVGTPSFRQHPARRRQHQRPRQFNLVHDPHRIGKRVGVPGVIPVQMRKGDEIDVLGCQLQRLQLCQQRDGYGNVHPRRCIAAFLGIVVVVSQARVPQKIALGMAYQETRHGDFSRLAVIFAGVGKSPHILESGVATVEDIQPEVSGTGLTGDRRAKTYEQQCHCRKRRFSIRVIHETGPPGPPYTSRTMSEHEHQHEQHEQHEQRASSALELRVRALEARLTEKGYIDPAALDVLIDEYQTKIGPRNGAQVVARAWAHPEFRRWLLEDATAAIASLGFTGRQGEHMVAVENTPAVHNMVVCTLCSCYPWSVLGLPPTWYKSAPYRARAVKDPRGVLKEFGVELPESTRIRIWDSTAEVRYLVLPQRPPRTERLSERELANLVTRDSMIGTGLPASAA